MLKRSLFALLAAACAPLAAHAHSNVAVSISTPGFGIRIGAPLWAPPVIVAAPVFAPAPVFVPTPVFVTAPVFAPPPVVFRPPVMLPPPVFFPQPRAPWPVQARPLPYAQAGYFMPPGHAKRYSRAVRYQ